MTSTELMAKKNTAKNSAPKAETTNKVNSMPFGRKNYRFMLIGVGLLALGYILMAADGETYGFGTLGLWVGPILLMAGFVFEVFAILAKPETTAEDQVDS